MSALFAVLWLLGWATAVVLNAYTSPRTTGWDALILFVFWPWLSFMALVALVQVAIECGGGLRRW